MEEEEKNPFHRQAADQDQRTIPGQSEIIPDQYGVELLTFPALYQQCTFRQFFIIIQQLGKHVKTLFSLNL